MSEVRPGPSGVTPEGLVEALPALWRFARSLQRSPADADDLVQETILRAMERGGTFRGESSLATWLHRIAFHLAVDRSRATARQVELDDIDRIWATDDYSVVDGAVAERVLDRMALEDALVHLPFILRSTVVLHDVEGWTVAEIAEATDVGLPAAKQRLRRGRMALVSELARDAERRVALDGVPMRCWDARRLVSDALDGRVAPEVAAGLEAHLASCPTCPPLYSALVETRAALGALRDPDSVIDPSTAERITQLVRGAADLGPFPGRHDRGSIVP